MCVLCLFCVVSVAAAQSAPPAWMDAQVRETQYSKALYYSGFAFGERQPGESVDETVQRIKDKARTEAVASVQVSVEQTINRVNENSVRTSNGTTDVVTNDRTHSHALLQSSIKDVPGLTVDSWVDPSTNKICAFAYVSKMDLQRKIEKRITVNLTKVSMTKDRIIDLLGKGDKAQARQDVAQGLSLIADVEADQMTLLAIDASLTSEDLSVAETESLKNDFIAFESQLAHGIYVKCDINATLFGKPYSRLAQAVRKGLSDAGCSFVDDSSAADWVVSIQGSAREYNSAQYGSTTAYFVYVDVDVSMTDMRSGLVVFSDQLSEKGSHTLRLEEAAREAYRKVETKLCETINKQIIK
ncbi:MAG: hypothetical protein KBT04_02485 [Bacteroidales bacterium]|nr:hypothetical protein [Candidatus Colimorpha onthohippi]